MKKLVKFFKETKQEGSKVIWSSKKETLATTSLVMVLLIISSLLFMLIDGIILRIVRYILGF